MAGNSRDVTRHHRRHEQRSKDQNYREAFARASREIDQVNSVMQALEVRRVELGISKAEIARRIDKDPAEVRRLLGTGTINPQLNTVVRIAHELGFDLCLVASSPD